MFIAALQSSAATSTGADDCCFLPKKSLSQFGQQAVSPFKSAPGARSFLLVSGCKSNRSVFAGQKKKLL